MIRLIKQRWINVETGASVSYEYEFEKVNGKITLAYLKELFRHKEEEGLTLLELEKKTGIRNQKLSRWFRFLTKPQK